MLPLTIVQRQRMTASPNRAWAISSIAYLVKAISIRGPIADRILPGLDLISTGLPLIMVVVEILRGAEIVIFCPLFSPWVIVRVIVWLARNIRLGFRLL